MAPNFPTAPQNTYSQSTFPADLTAAGRNFKTVIQFVEYKGSYAIDSALLSGGTYTPTGGVTLPLPKKINDTMTVEWSRSSLIEMAASLASNSKLAAGGALGDVASAGTGLQLNPMQFMVFKQQNFKEHTLNWSLTPSSPEESNALNYIINQFKYHMLPTANGMLLEYPSIALIKLYPNDEFTFRFRPCAIVGVQTDYTGAGMPSFFRNGAPTTVNFTVYLKEITLWDKTNFKF